MMKRNKDKTRSSRQAYNGSKQISFLPEPDFNPKIPSKNTLAYRALLMMLQGRKISHPNFQDRTSSWRLAAHVHVLKKLGWPIETVEVSFHAEKKPTNRSIHHYFLSPDVIKKLEKTAKEVRHA